MSDPAYVAFVAQVGLEVISTTLYAQYDVYYMNTNTGAVGPLSSGPQVTFSITDWTLACGDKLRQEAESQIYSYLVSQSKTGLDGTTPLVWL